jgi:hypothetical protein
MARSKRKPYSYYTGLYCNLKRDRHFAARGVRSRQNQETRSELKRQQTIDHSTSAYFYEDPDECELLLSPKHACSHNNCYSWASDGLAHYFGNTEAECDFWWSQLNVYLNAEPTEKNLEWVEWYQRQIEKEYERAAELTRK